MPPDDKNKNTKTKHTQRESKADWQASLWNSMRSRIYKRICIWSLESLCGDSAISFHFIAFFPQQIFIVELSLSFKPRIRRKLGIPFCPFPSHSLANKKWGSNEPSFEESSALHFVLVSLAALGQNYLLQK